MPDDDENLLSASSLASPSASSSSSEQTTEHNVMKGEEGSREGKVAKTDLSKINDCHIVTTEVISDRKK